ncbi:hypothetical protein C1645_842710 [Glomus cerebriforme]|uniref:BED-type domain-containing protein n=1 Tax=Glomus cerebriforme TaxID=658196 RepID=A0A397S8N9_9GLOM|nr:hypothetical protein C1645_842710 [Glomus cerebriforme]
MAETGETRSQKRINDNNNDAETRKKTRGGSPKFDDVWQYFIKGEEVNSGHYKATCYHCKKILLEHDNIISNLDIYGLMQDEEFFQIHSIWAPIKECINILEAKSASLADCFVYMIKLAVAIFRLLSSNPYKASAIQIFNHCYLEFQHPAYLLCYFLILIIELST